MRRLSILAVLAVLGVLTSAALASHYRYPHHHECSHPACARAADVAYARIHRPKLGPMSSAEASWYDDAGSTASGEHAALGFAHLGPGEDAGGWVPPEGGLAMGTRVRFCAVRCAIGTMDDHGPYVAGRSFDLGPELKAAIGASDLGTVRYRILR